MVTYRPGWFEHASDEVIYIELLLGLYKRGLNPPAFREVVVWTGIDFRSSSP